MDASRRHQPVVAPVGRIHGTRQSGPGDASAKRASTAAITRLPKIYAEMSAAGVAVTDFHDITSGNNGFAAGAGYDLVTGVGSPIGAGTIANLMDDAPPTAAASTTDVVSAGAAPNTFTVVFSDNHNVKVSTLNSSDIMLQGPGGSIPVTFVSVTPSGNGPSRTATYQFTPPGGDWNSSDNGTYNVVLQANQVSDTAGNFAVTGTIGSFSVNIVDCIDHRFDGRQRWLGPAVRSHESDGDVQHAGRFRQQRPERRVHADAERQHERVVYRSCIRSWVDRRLS